MIALPLLGLLVGVTGAVLLPGALVLLGRIPARDLDVVVIAPYALLAFVSGAWIWSLHG